MGYIRGAYGMSRWDGECNMYDNFGMDVTEKGMDCGAAEQMKHGVLRWFGHAIKINEDDCEVCEGITEGEGATGRPPVKWIKSGQV